MLKHLNSFLFFLLFLFLTKIKDTSQMRLLKNNSEIVKKDENLKEFAEKLIEVNPVLKSNQTYIRMADIDKVDMNLDELNSNEEISSSKSFHEPKTKETERTTFSIHAQKVYILYPTSFMQPNIFGQMSIPQKIKMENDLKDIDETLLLKQDQASNPIADDREYTYPISNNDIQSRNFLKDKKNNKYDENDEEKRVDITTHLKGNIVVLNQDLNEVNKPE